jgi:hypothetical protein
LNELLRNGFTTKVKRNVSNQPVSVPAVHDILVKHPGFAIVLTDCAVEHAIERYQKITKPTLLPFRHAEKVHPALCPFPSRRSPTGSGGPKRRPRLTIHVWEENYVQHPR